MLTLDFYHNIPVKECHECKNPIEEQHECYINICESCREKQEK